MKQISPELSFHHVLGQDRAQKLVSRSLKAERLPHAYIFKGPDGVGKQLFARGLAATINCRGEGAMACGTCSSCKKFASNNHPDFLLVAPEKGMIKINQVREMARALDYPPYESSLRIVLLEDVHTMRREAANSLLKTLEEPPPGNLLILTADASQEVLPTISSRCQAVPFFGLSEELVMSVVRNMVPDIDPETTQLLARLAEGSPGRALVLYEAELAPLLKKLIIHLQDQEMGRDEQLSLLLFLAEELSALKEHLPELLGLIRIWLRDMLLTLHNEQCQSGLTDFFASPEKSWKSWSSEQLFAKLRAVTRAENALKRNCNRTLVCEVLLFDLQDKPEMKNC